MKYFLGHSVLRSSWDQVFAAFWQRYPNPYSKHVLTEDIVHREVTPDQKLLSRRLLTKTNRMPPGPSDCFLPMLLVQCTSWRFLLWTTEPDHLHLEYQPHLADGGGGTMCLLCEL